MRLAEALILRASQKKKLAQLVERLKENVLIQDGSEPVEDPNKLLEQFQAVCREFEKLIGQINATNSTTKLGDGSTLTEALARRDVLKILSGSYREFAKSATPKQTAHTRSEIRYKPTIDVSQVQASADNWARELRELDTKVQEANWSTDLVE